MSYSVVIVAAGSGERAGPGGPKQWRKVGGKPVARWSVETFLKHGAERIVVVVAAGHEEQARQAFAGLEGWSTVVGGATRTQSVRAGLAALGAGPDEAVLIHDAARPFVTGGQIDALLDALTDADGALPALPVPDTLKTRSHGSDGVTTTPRENLWRAQTPQAFRASAVIAAYADCPADAAPTDDASVVERHGGKVVLTPGDPMLFKLTYPEDFAMAEAMIAATRITRIGQGFDVHAFGPGDAVWLCGVRIAHGQGLVGQSDADVGLHALTDALLGAIGEGDIGDHFPPTDPKWKGADSSVFLRHAASLIADRGGEIVNVDVTLICEAPKIKPHREAMRARIAELLGLGTGRVSVKATTTEQLGFTGRGEGMAAQAVAAVATPV
jgi:2-C-methyl-D-erythritol 4-phosphate cytidylyltransferase/2-C-methyl-D-erythritol 2,4-cyclodiphosphate synthase